MYSNLGRYGGVYFVPAITFPLRAGITETLSFLRFLFHYGKVASPEEIERASAECEVPELSVFQSGAVWRCLFFTRYYISFKSGNHGNIFIFAFF